MAAEHFGRRDQLGPGAVPGATAGRCERMRARGGGFSGPAREGIVLGMRRSLALVAVTSVLVSLFALPAANAQPNSPSGNEPATQTDQTPSQGGPSNSTPTNAGSDDTSGNRTTPGGAGATGGGTGTGESRDNGGGKGLIGFLVLLAVACVAAFVVITRRNKQAEDQLEQTRRA